MSIDKTIRIQDLPASSFLESDNLIIINDNDNITRSVTFDNFVASISEFPGGINIPPTSPGVPGISFCPDDNENCGTGIGSWKDCELFISVCDDTVVEINQGGMDLNGDLIIGGNLEVSKDTELNGNVTLGNGCDTTDFVVKAKSLFECEVTIEDSVNIGVPGSCDKTLIVDAAATFNCATDFNDNVTIDGNLAVDGEVNFTGGPFKFDGDFEVKGDINFEGDLTLMGDLLLNGNIKPPGNGNLELVVDKITVENELVVQGDASIGLGCDTKLDIMSETEITCDTTIGNPLEDTKLLIQSDTTINNNDLVVDEGNVTVNEGDVTVNEGNILVNDGDITVTGDDRGFVGDGSRITNLNIPDNLTFKGDTDVTGTAPSNPDNGDFYLNMVTGIPDGSWTGMTAEVKQNQFVYYSSAAATPGWFAGKEMDDEGLVTLNGNQTITGQKFHTAKISLGTDGPKTENIILGTNGNISAVGDMQVDGAVTFTSTLDVTGKATAGSTETTDPGETVVTKDYLDASFPDFGDGDGDTLDERYVKVVGDNMTGSLTLGPATGPENITLFANDGKATFANTVRVGGEPWNGQQGAAMAKGTVSSCNINDTAVFLGRKVGGPDTFHVRSDGSVKIGGSVPLNPNISLNASGSGTFKGNVQSGGSPFGAAADGIAFNAAGLVEASRSAGTDTIFRGYVTGNTKPNVEIRADGTTQIGGTIPSAPNISLNANGTVVTNNFIKSEWTTTSAGQAHFVSNDTASVASQWHYWGGINGSQNFGIGTDGSGLVWNWKN